MGIFNHVIIETTNICNLRCVMCPTLSYTNEHMVMSDNMFDSIINQLNEIDRISLEGWGEPLTDKKIFDRINRAEIKLSKGGSIGFTTNATLFDRFRAEEIKNCSVSNINISLDGGTKKIYESIRLGANFEQVIRSIKSLVELGQNISVTMTISKKNMHEVVNFLECMYALKVRNIFLKPTDVVSSSKVKNLVLTENDLSQIKENVLEWNKMVGGFLNIGMWNFESSQKPIGNCLANPLETMFIGVDGTISPCCNLGHHVPRYQNLIKQKYDTFCGFGNVNEKTLEQIWNSEKYGEFRTAISEGNRPKECYLCNIY